MSDADLYLKSIQEITGVFHRWISSSLVVEDERDRDALAAWILATLDGVILMNSTDQRSLVDWTLAGITQCCPVGVRENPIVSSEG
jgi:dsDNA-binding SOS-regulon protein